MKGATLGVGEMEVVALLAPYVEQLLLLIPPKSAQSLRTFSRRTVLGISARLSQVLKLDQNGDKKLRSDIPSFSSGVQFISSQLFVGQMKASFVHCALSAINFRQQERSALVTKWVGMTYNAGDVAERAGR